MAFHSRKLNKTPLQHLYSTSAALLRHLCSTSPAPPQHLPATILTWTAAGKLRLLTTMEALAAKGCSGGSHIATRFMISYLQHCSSPVSVGRGFSEREVKFWAMSSHNADMTQLFDLQPPALPFDGQRWERLLPGA